MNENYAQPAMPDGVEEGILRGMYLLREAPEGDGPRVQLLGSGIDPPRGRGGRRAPRRATSRSRPTCGA